MPPDQSQPRRDHRTRYLTALNHAQLQLEQLLESDPNSWKPVPSSSSSSSSNNNNNPLAPSSSSSSSTSKHDIFGSTTPDQVVISKLHSPTAGSPQVYKATLDVPLHLNSTQSKLDLLEIFKTVLNRPETRSNWDKLVQQSNVLEVLDPDTRVLKTDFRIGWPASPRDTVTISKTLLNTNDLFLIDFQTSLPRFATNDEPSFLRPCPPFLRSNLKLWSWVIEFLPKRDDDDDKENEKLRISLYSSWNLNRNHDNRVGGGTGGKKKGKNPYEKHFKNLLNSLVGYVRSCSSSISSTTPTTTTSRNILPPGLRNWTPSENGGGIEIIREEWDDANCKWLGEWEHRTAIPSSSAPEVTTIEERKGKGKGKGKEEGEESFIEIRLPSTSKDGWDIKITSTSVSNSRSPSDSVAVIDSQQTSPSSSSSSSSSLPTTTPSPKFSFQLFSFSSSSSSTSTATPSPVSSSSTSSTESTLISRYSLKISHARQKHSTTERFKLVINRSKGGVIRVNGSTISPTPTTDTKEEKEEQVENKEQQEKELKKWEQILRNRKKTTCTNNSNQNLSLLPPTNTTTNTNTTTSSSSSTSSSTTFENSSSISFRSTNSSSSTTRSSTTISNPRTAFLSSSPSASQISLLLRRSYIYFLSLLQEPSQKWKPVIDSYSSGVTVSQLLSPDPTLTIFRAEAVFVGVGIWDVWSGVLNGWSKASWDKGIEDSRLLIRTRRGKRRSRRRGNEDASSFLVHENRGEEVGIIDDEAEEEEEEEEEEEISGTESEEIRNGELSELWWEKRKGNWPVAPRDSVTLRTSYKSPSSIHIFSFSTDDTNLFPSIPSVNPPTIRTQTDLLGWSIEALSPTTTSITLLDQSDPKGWSNKSNWTPNHLIGLVSGVRDFTIKYGAPPVVTRLKGARKKQVGYEFEKSVWRVEYELPSSTREGGGGGGGEGSETSTIKSLSNKNLLDGQEEEEEEEPIELELRCDNSVWSNSNINQGIELMIDPPPSSVSCLSRHRLSTLGGGLWLTIQHPPSLLISEGKVIVTVRKVNNSNNGGGGVIINGAKVKVDVEVLEEEKIRELEARKRRKFSPVPLDQYETLGARTWFSNNPGSLGGVGESKKSTQVEQKKQDSSNSVAPTTPITDSPVEGQNLKPASVNSVDPTTANDPSSPSVPPTERPLPNVDSNENPIPKKLPFESPPAAALEALAYLQSFHAEQGPELTNPAPGWSIVSERSNCVVRKKIIPKISETVPIYRGDKIVQGLTAEEILSIVTSAGSRKRWDEKVESCKILESFGNGMKTMALLTKPSFPFFKGRVFFTSTVTASVKVPSASSNLSTSTVLFVASASYNPSTSASPSFDPSLVNPNSLLTGQVLLEGWILETLDPYTSSVLAIPSTRCTYLSCIDLKGSVVPLALQNVNSNLSRMIGNVESFGKLKGPLPRIWLPCNDGLLIEGPLSEDGSEGDCVWKLGNSNNGSSSRVLLSNYGEEENTFRALFKLGRGGNSTLGTGSDKEERDDSTSSKIDKPPSLTTKPSLLKSELPRSASLNFGTAAPPILHKSSVTSELSHKRSRGSLRSKSPAAPPVATTGASSSSSSSPSTGTSGPPSGSSTSTLTTANDPNAHDLVVAEFIVDLKQYPHGYSVVSNSTLLYSSSSLDDSTLSLDSLQHSSDTSPPTISLPLRLTAHDAPLPSILTASLDAWKRANHLVRILVPTSSITHPVKDPLRDPPAQLVEKPEWFKILNQEDGGTGEGGGALVEIKISPLPEPTMTTTTSSLNDQARTKPIATNQSTGTGTGNTGNLIVEPTGLGKVTGQANKTVMFNGEKVTVKSQKESKMVLMRFEDEEVSSNLLQGIKLSRVPRRKRKSSSNVLAVDFESSNNVSSSSITSSLPLELQKPLAISTKLLAPPKPTTPSILEGSEDDFEFPDPKSPGMMTPAMNSKDSGSPVMSKSNSLQPTSNRRSTTGSESAPFSSGGPFSAILGSYPLARLGSSLITATNPSTYLQHQQSGTSSSSKESTNLEGGGEAEGGRIGTAGVGGGGGRQYSLGFVISIALIAFLLGSFLRSLLTPADYIIYHPISSQPLSTITPGTGTGGESSVEKALLTAFDPHRHWKEAKRLIELRTGVLGWDLILAAVKKDN